MGRGPAGLLERGPGVRVEHGPACTAPVVQHRRAMAIVNRQGLIPLATRAPLTVPVQRAHQELVTRLTIHQVEDRESIRTRRASLMGDLSVTPDERHE